MGTDRPSILDEGTIDSRHMRGNDVLAELCRAIVKTRGAAAVARDAARRLQRYFGTASVGLWWVEDEHLRLEGLALSDECDASLERRIREEYGRSPRSEGLPGSRAIEERRILRLGVDDPDLRPDVRSVLRALETTTLVCIPIYVEGDPVGVGLVGAPEDRPLTGADESLLESALGVLGIVYHRTLLQEREDERHRRALHAYQMAMVGELAAGVAHEVNNPLSVISGLAEVLAERPGLPDGVYGDLEVLREQALRAGGIIRQLLVFARRDQEEKRPVNLPAVVESVAMLHGRRNELAGIELEIRADEDLPPVPGRQSDLQHMVHILLMNARRSIEENMDGGRIVVRLRASDRTVDLAVRDSGPGIAPGLLGHIFDPFFTTREGEGVGLGLATAYEIVRDHGGVISAENWGAAPVEGGTVGSGGARFAVRLPLGPGGEVGAGETGGGLRVVNVPTSGESAPDAAAEAADAEPDDVDGSSAGGNQHLVLLVEDDEAVAHSIRKLLKHLGYRVASAGTGEEALEVLDRRDDVELILSDVRMPGMGGQGLFEALREKRPEMVERLVFSSGDLISPETRRFLSNVDRPVLAKPYGVRDLGAALESVLEGLRA